jgi:hypothetical protein
MQRTELRSAMKRSRWLGAAALLWVASGCASNPAEPPATDLVACTDPRPQVCTMQYDPVCARIGEGDAAEWKTYASDCSACGDAQVSAYRPGGECK